MMRIIAFLAAVVFSSCFFMAHAGTPPGSPADLRAGFYLLHKVSDEESQVAMLNLIKTTPPDVADYVKHVSQAAHDNLDLLDRMADHDPSLRDAPNPLPAFEIATRANIAADKQHLLLFGSTGPTFARRLLFTQVEASNYIVNLAKTWAQRDPDAGHDAAMQKMSARWAKLREEGYRLLDESR